MLADSTAAAQRKRLSKSRKHEWLIFTNKIQLQNKIIANRPTINDVMSSRIQIGNVALSFLIIPNRHRTAITSEKNGMVCPSSHLAIGEALLQQWNVALALIVAPTGHDIAIASEKKGVIAARRDLGVWHPNFQLGNVAFCITSAPANYSAAVTRQKNCDLTLAGRNLGVDCLLIQHWNDARSTIVDSTSKNTAITAEENAMRLTCWNLLGFALNDHKIKNPVPCHGGSTRGEIQNHPQNETPCYPWRNPLNSDPSSPECMSFLRPAEVRCIVQKYSARRPQHVHHFGEARCDSHLQRPEHFPKQWGLHEGK